MPAPRNALTLATIATLALGGCGEGAGRYPSLAQRPIEREFANAAPIAPPAPQGPSDADPATLKQIESLHADAAQAAETFATRAAEAARLARGAKVGSEAWATATVAMAALDSARSATALPLAELDALRVHSAVIAADSGKPRDAATYAAITQADDDVTAMLAKEDARIAALNHEVGD